jgi:hypothetical protein
MQKIHILEDEILEHPLGAMSNKKCSGYDKKPPAGVLITKTEIDDWGGVYKNMNNLQKNRSRILKNNINLKKKKQRI